MGQQPVIGRAVRVVAAGTVPVLNGAVRIRIRRQHPFHVCELLVLALDGFVVALQADVEAVRQEQVGFLRLVRIVTVHASGVLGDRGVLDYRCLLISDGFFMAFSANLGERGCQHISLPGQVRGMAIRALRSGSFVAESGIDKSGAHIGVTFQAHLFAGDAQHSRDIPAVRIVAGDTGSGGERPVNKASLELVLFVALEAKRLLCLNELRKSSLDRNLMTELAQILFRKQTTHFCGRHSSMAVGAILPS